ncbi:hypothetical protein B0H10DRAFT_1900844 [Mycena sp. CBHHK59/15]|nr:hypothetical protein B0H10DRAFT_1900844 [Mycena sp. CBHHK59/15]
MSDTESSDQRLRAPPPVIPQSPFDDAGADTILRSSDGFDFLVYRAVLSLASPFFKDMFSIPQPESEPDVPVISVAEPSHLLDLLLRVWYPGAEVVIFDGLEQLSQIIELAISKYDIQFVVPTLRKYLQGYLEAKPIGVFAIACRYQWAELAKAAAKQCLKLPLHSLFHSEATRHLMHISAHLYQSLFIYHDKCGVAASSAGALLPWSDAGWVWIKCTTCPAYSLQCGVPGLTGRRTPRAWIFDYVDRASAVLKERPGASVFDLAFLAPTQAKAAACRGDCASSGFKDLATFILEKYVPKVNAAVDAVSLELHF